VKTSRRHFRPGDRVELRTLRGSERAAIVVAADVLGAVVQMDRVRSDATLSCWSWELVPLPTAVDRGLPA
jgi:hypothetical protein